MHDNAQDALIAAINEKLLKMILSVLNRNRATRCMRMCLALSLLNCILVGKVGSQNRLSAPIEADIISDALKGTVRRTLISGSYKTEIYVNSVTVPSTDSKSRPLNLIWIVFPRQFATLRTCPVNKIGPSSLLYETYAPKGALAVIDGGFYGFNDAHKGIPLGLLISDGVQVSGPVLAWKSGGIVFSREDSSIEIVPIAEKNKIGSPRYALQAKPLLIESGKLAVRPNRNDSPFNRSAVGLTAAGDLVVAGAFKEDLQALTLYDFGRFLALLGPLERVRINIALNLDGANDAHLYVAPSGIHFGYPGSNYVPDALAIVPR